MSRREFVRVKPPRAPRRLVVDPLHAPMDGVKVDPVTLRGTAEPTARNETLRTAWLVDGAAAGEGETFTFTPERPVVVRAQVQSDLGPVVRLEWRLEPTAPPPLPPAARPLARADVRPSTPPRSAPEDAPATRRTARVVPA